MTLSDVAIGRPVFTSMLSVAILVLGVLGFRQLGTDLYPDVSIPFCTVTTIYPGAGPADIEEQLTRPLEDALAGIPGIDRLFSQSRENVSSVFVQFKLAVPLAEAVQQVRDKVGSAQGFLPSGARPPVIAQFDIAAQPILVFSASSTDDPVALRNLLNDRVKPRLEQLEGVAAAHVLGGTPREIAVDLFADRLRALNLTPDAVLRRIRSEHLDLPAGRFNAGPGEVGIRVDGAFKDVDGLRHMVVATAPDGSEVRLQDVALVRETAAEARTLVRTNGREALAVEVIKQSGTNTVQVAGAAKQVLDALHTEMGERFSADVLIDPSRIIEANAHEVWMSIYFGGAMAILIILLFLMDMRGTLISALALPTSVVGTLFVMWLLDYSLNQVTLLGLSLAIGLLIDDAVVVRESITRRLEAGEPPARAASLGTQEIALAVLATTFTLCAVFVPVAFMQGMVGQFFRQFGITITAAVLISLFVAFTLDPMLSARFARSHKHHPWKVPLERFFTRLDAAYAASLGWVLGHRKAVFWSAVALFLGSLALGSVLGTDFLGNEDRGQLIVDLEFPPGTRLATTSSRSAVAEQHALQLPGVRSVYAVMGPHAQVEKAQWRVLLIDKQARSQNLDWYKQHLRRILADVPQARTTVANPPMIEGVGDWPPIWVQVVGPDFATLRGEAKFVADALAEVPGAADVRLRDTPGKPELTVHIDRAAASRVDMPAGAIAAQVRLSTQGEVAGKLRQGRREADIRVRLSPEGRASPEALQRLWVWGPRGPMTLDQVADLRPAEGPAVIEHEMRERQISVTAQVAPGAHLGEVAADLRARLEKHTLPFGYNILWNGQQKEMRDMMINVAFALGLALVFIFMVLASQFESLLHPFTIMLSLPLALVGAVLALAIAGYPFALGAYIGIILLMGLVTKNAILLVDGALQHVRLGNDPAQAMLHAGPRRLRPILMTSAAMVLGMLPTALGRGTGSEFRAPMAMAVIGGVITSTVLTLWVVPVVFVWVEALRQRRWLGAANRAAAPPTSQEANLRPAGAWREGQV